MWRNDSMDSDVQNILLNPQNVDIKRKVEVVLKISYRFRDNLYHGNKEYDEINSYSTCFKKINEFVKLLLQDIENSDYLNDMTMRGD
ncbi:hypothetical protein FACS1894167_06820 [Synergistales bacterium]|nr:hypothetical protein FACS1894167_06820 [Synergistales bacterium]